MNAPQPISGFGKLGNFCRKILSYAKSLELHPGSIIIERMAVGVTTPPSAEITSTPSGPLVKLKINSGGQGGGQGGVGHFPWEISVDSAGVVSVRPGSVNSLVPSNIFDTFGPLGTGTYWVKIRCATDGKTPNAITIVVDTTPVDPANLVGENVAPSTFYDTIGLVVSSFTVGGAFNGQIYQVRRSNIVSNPIIMFLVPQTPVSPGDEPFVRWWGWNLGLSA